MFKPKFFLISAVLLFLLLGSTAFSSQESLELPALTVFHSPTCHSCVKIKNEVMPKIEEKFKGRIQITYLDLSDIESYRLLISLEEKYSPQKKPSLPVFYMAGKILSGSKASENSLGVFIEEGLKRPFQEERLTEVDLPSRFKNFKFLVVLAAGLIDGINPCAFTVIVFFMSYLALQGLRKKELAIVGASFILALFITYILLGLGLFTFLYQIKGFWLVSKIINLAIGVLSIILGFFAVYDYLQFRRTKDTEGLKLQLPKTIKNQIHKIIGKQYRNTGEKTGAYPKHFFGLVTGTFITGFLVTILEAVCTGQTYLPTISFILKTTPLKLQATLYLFIYNLMFVLPLVIIFVLALLGATSGEFAKFLKKHLLTVKALMAILFFALGIFIIWRA